MKTWGAGRFFLFRGVDHQKTDGFGDLDCRQSYARRVMHGLDHVVDQAAQIIIHALDLLTDEAQFGIGQNDDRFEGHAGLFEGEARKLIIGWTSAVKRVLTLFLSDSRAAVMAAPDWDPGEP